MIYDGRITFSLFPATYGRGKDDGKGIIISPLSQVVMSEDDFVLGINREREGHSPDTSMVTSEE